MKRYQIVGTEYLAEDKEVVICELDSNPEAAVEALKEKTLQKPWRDTSLDHWPLQQFADCRSAHAAMTPIQPIPYAAVEGSWKLALIVIVIALTAGTIIARRS